MVWSMSVETDYSNKQGVNQLWMTWIPIIYSNLLVTCDIFKTIQIGWVATFFFSLPLNAHHAIFFSHLKFLSFISYILCHQIISIRERKKIGAKTKFCYCRTRTMFPYHFGNKVTFIIEQQWALVISGNNRNVYCKRHSLQERKWDFVILMNTHIRVWLRKTCDDSCSKCKTNYSPWYFCCCCIMSTKNNS